jgi:hypothetical protein
MALHPQPDDRGGHGLDSAGNRIVRSSWRAVDLAAATLLWLGALSLVFSLWLFAGRNFNTFPPAQAEAMIHGGANRPYSSRVLVPWAVRGLIAPWPSRAVENASDALAESAPGAALLRYFDAPPRSALELLLVLALDALSLLGFALVLRRLFDRLYSASLWVSRTAPVAALLLLPLFFARGAHYLYDFPALLFFTAALYCIRAEKHALLYLVLALGTLNKETMAIALLALYLVHRDRPAGTGWRRRLALQAAVVLLARLAAVALSSPGGAPGPANGYLRNYLIANAVEFLRDPFLLSFTRTAALLLLGLLIFGRWSSRPLFLRRVAPVALVFFALYLVGSQWGEIRSLYEAFPILFLLGWASVVERLGLDLGDRDLATAAPVAAVATLPRPSPWQWALAAAVGLGAALVAIVAAARVV